jgi:diacylglycerol kinase (ATP)
MIAALRNEAIRLKYTVIWSVDGWRAAWASEASLRHWTRLNAASVVLAMVLDLSSVERALVVGFGLMILVAELLNTSIEDLVDRIDTAQHPLSKKIKDVGSAGVAIAAVAAGLVWLIVLIG